MSEMNLKFSGANTVRRQIFFAIPGKKQQNTHTHTHTTK